MKQWLRNCLASIKGTPTSTNSASEPAKYLHDLQIAKADFERIWNDPTNTYTAQLAEFELISVLGHGKFGKVVFAKYRRLKPYEPNAFVAIKIISKRAMIDNRGPQHVNAEKKCLQAVRNPFFIKYKHHFKDNANLYLVTEYVPGGDLYTRLKRIHKYEESHVLFYASQIVLAFEYLHFMGIVYRDLKPENILLDQMGYLKIADLGLCKKIDHGTTRTMCGTPEYLAPELIYGHAYAYSIDWWAFGILIFELMYGRTPFRTNNLVQLLRNIINAQLTFPPKPETTVDAKKLISELLRKQITERLVEPTEMKRMSFFASIDWPAIYARRLPAPYVPRIESATDTSNFDKQPPLHIDESATDLYAEAFKDF